MHFGVTGCFGGFEGLTFPERVKLLQEAERLGYESIWLNEEHFVPRERLCLAPIPLNSYLAGQTDRLRLGFSVLQLPVHDPLRLAEDIANLDFLSNGRVEFGISRSGNDRYHRGFGSPIEERTDRFYEGLDCILQFWTSPGMSSHNGLHYHYEDVDINPRPVQKPHPPVHIGARDPASVRRVASAGHKLIEGIIQALHYTLDDIAAFREGAAEVGRVIGPDDITFGRWVFVAETDEKAHAESRRAVEAIARNFRTSGHIQRGFVVDEEELKPENVERQFLIVGSPDTCAARISELRKDMGFGRFNCAFGLGGHATPEQIYRSLRLFGKEVVPALAGS